MLTDLAESDGLMASAYLLPQLVSAALLNATVDQPGWREGRKVAGRAYAVVTSGLVAQDDPDALRMLSLHNRQNITYSLDVMIASLRALRDDIEKGDDESVKDRLQSAHEGREAWLNERISANWDDMKKEPAEYPSLGEKLLGGIIGRRPKKK
jgi:prephenate dehydrogenase